MTVEELLEGQILAIDKPRCWSSFQAVNKVKSVVRNRFGLKKFKIGHAGTLDPLASGLLLVCIGRATKLISSLQEGTKEYTGTFVFGASTPCFDLERPIDQYFPYEHLCRENVTEASRQFLGKIEQVPPIFSAVKVNGQRAYTLGRDSQKANADSTADADASNAEDILKSRNVEIYQFDITDFRNGNPTTPLPPIVPTADLPDRHLYDHPLGSVPEALPQADFHIACSKGTYIRSIARDMGLALDSGAFLGALRRTRVGDFTIENALSIDQIISFFE